jgi:hypothetical protein
MLLGRERRESVAQVPEPVSPRYRNRVREVSPTYRNHDVQHEPGPHIRDLTACRQSLGQTPPCRPCTHSQKLHLTWYFLVGLAGFEPATS